MSWRVSTSYSGLEGIYSRINSIAFRQRAKAELVAIHAHLVVSQAGHHVGFVSLAVADCRGGYGSQDSPVAGIVSLIEPR